MARASYAQRLGDYLADRRSGWSHNRLMAMYLQMS